MKKIAVVGLYSIPNMGDKILCEVTQYLVRNISPEVEIIPVDVCPRYASDYHGLEYIKYRFSRKMKTSGEKKFKYEDDSTYRYRYEYFYWWLRLNRYYKKILKDVDAIVFAGGGFIKFRTQGLNYYVEQIIKIAEERNIPVMMNGVGIEGYSEEDIRCQKLKTAINKNCVKIITTRDDIDILKEKYIINKNIQTDRVGDPAFWIPECYGVSTGHSKTGVVGINVIRGKVFVDYGNKSTFDQLIDFYRSLISSLDALGLDWLLFSNGMKGDQKFGKMLLEELGLEDDNKLLPAPSISEELIDMIKGFDCIFGARLHACITAYSLDIPVVGFIWNEKTRIFSRMIDTPDRFFEEHDLDTNIIAETLKKSIDEAYDETIRNKLKNSTKKYLEGFIESL